MKTLFLLRHAKSSWDEPADDHDRPLAGRGRRAALAMAEHMASQGLRPERVLCSSAARTTETWSLMAPLLGDPPVEVADDLYLAAPPRMLEILREVPDSVASVLLLGHNPGIEELARRLAGDGDLEGLRRLRKKYPTGALAVLGHASHRWADLEHGGLELSSFVRPKDLPDARRRRL